MPLVRTGDFDCWYESDCFVDPWLEPETILIQHGFGRTGRYWNRWVPDLARHYRVIRRDMRGHGGSGDSGPGYVWSVEGLVDDVVSFLDALGLDSVHCIGESVGGPTGIALAVQHRERLRSLTIVSALPAGPRGARRVGVNDRVEKDGEVVEDTDDWFGQRKDGTIDYCGEISREFEFLEGDDFEEAELVSIEGSWKAGRDGDLPGTLFPGSPQVGAVYRQEWSPGNAEDAAEVLSTSYGFGDDAELDRFVPRALAERLCAGDCVVTREFTPLEPGAAERKYYARGIGLFLEVNTESGDVVQLVDCNFAAMCNDLPTP